jgi:succinylglutamate desuccinylase
MEITEEPIILKGTLPGPTSVILAGVHGNERGGIEAFTALLPNLSIENGTVVFLYGNPLAIANNVRFVEANLNRMFRDDSTYTNEEKNTYEYKRAQQLKKYLNDADALLDIHSSFSPISRPFIITEPNSAYITEKLPFNLIVYGFDAVEPGGTDYYMNSIGKTGICIECGYLGDSSSNEIAKESIMAFLSVQGHISNESYKILAQEHCLIDLLYITKTDSFVLAKSFEDFEVVTAGQTIATDGGIPVLAENDGIILFARNREKAHDEGFLLGTYEKNHS